VNLYHYTDQNGFLGIFGNKELWATRIQYLNDAKEFILTKELAERALKAMLRDHKYESSRFRIERFISNLDNYTSQNLCVSSLSEERDALSQWRGYSNSHGGYSIGFKKDDLISLIEGQGLRIEKCIYDEVEQVDVISNVIRESLEKFKDCPEPYLDEVEITSESTSHFLKKLTYVSTYIKDVGFSEEKEWRIIGLVQFKDLDFRAGRSSLIPFTKINLESRFTDLISEIVVGHTPNMKLAVEATDCFLIKNYRRMNSSSYEHDFTIEESQIPYRSW